MNYTKTERLNESPCWVHNDKPVWIVYYPATRVRPQFWQAYRSTQLVLKGCNPWATPNRRIGTDDGFETLEAAMAAGDAA